VAEKLVHLQANINHKNFRGDSLLHWAAKNRNLRVVKFLLSIEDIDRSVRDSAGYSPLHCAAANGFFEMIDNLLSAGVNIDERTSNEGYTAVLRSALGAVDQLRNVLDMDIWSLLFPAENRNHPALVGMICENVDT